jgi:hypothetical protein
MDLRATRLLQVGLIDVLAFSAYRFVFARKFLNPRVKTNYFVKPVLNQSDEA